MDLGPAKKNGDVFRVEIKLFLIQKDYNSLGNLEERFSPPFPSTGQNRDCGDLFCSPK